MEKKKTIKIAVSNQKGGCGKTTTVMNLGAALAVRGRQVLLVDFDPQHHLSNWLGFEPDGKPTTTEIIYNTVANIPVSFDDFIRRSKTEDFDYIPATPLLVGMLGILGADKDSTGVVSRIFSNDYFKKYDYILFDCQTALDLLVTNVLKSCDKLLIPVQADLLSYNGVKQMIQTLIEIKNDTEIHKYLLGLLITMYVSNTKHSATIKDALKESYGDLVYDTYISYRTEAKNAVGYKHSSVADKHSAVGAEYIDIANRVMGVCENV